MKYLSVVDYCFPDRPGGSGRVAWDISTALQRRGHEVTTFCCRNAGSDSPEGPATESGIDIVRYARPSLPSWHPNRLRANIAAAAAAARRWLKEDSWDVVHIHDPSLGLGVMRALGDEVRYVTTVHSPILLEQAINWGAQGVVGQLKLLLGTGMLRRLEKTVLEKSHAIHVLSEYTRSELDAYHGVGPRTTVIPHWCEKRTDCIGKIEARQRLGWPKEKVIFFSVRQLRPRYGLDLAIRALAQLRPFNAFEYYVAGDGHLRPFLELLIQQSGLNACVKLMGRISDTELNLAYQAADLFILPTRQLECFGLIILESLSWGCPLIASDAGAIPEVLGRVLPDSTTPAGDSDALRNRLEAALSGQLTFPSPDELVSRVTRVYGEESIFPRMESLLIGTSNP